ncbi:hypothetical protein C8F01DRAFT_122954 [Mycena amicta]|nr:hypothetical protein C8F01DRAFT_122954 [Mycena amicta]
MARYFVDELLVRWRLVQLRACSCDRLVTTRSFVHTTMKNAHAASQPNSSPHGTLEELAQGYLTSIETQRVLANASMHHIQSFKSALAAAQGELAKASEETSNAKSECEAAKREVWKQADSARREREEMMKEVLKANANANKKVEAMRAQVDELQSKLQAAHLDLRDFDWLSAKYASLKAQYAEAQVELKELRQEKVVSPSLDTPTLRHLQMNDPVSLQSSIYGCRPRTLEPAETHCCE